jgi:hypothetical protein
MNPAQRVEAISHRIGQFYAWHQAVIRRHTERFKTPAWPSLE